MAWVAEILRKQHRTCAVCGLSPTHLYTPRRQDDEAPLAEDEEAGSRLCNGCLPARLEKDLAAMTGRLIIFEPCMGPDSLLFSPMEQLEDEGVAAPAVASARAVLAAGGEATCACGGRSCAVWVPSSEDAGLWGTEWLDALASGEIVPQGSLCPTCASSRLVRSLEERGLHCETIETPSGGDGVLLPGA